MRYTPSRGLEERMALAIVPAVTRLAEIAADGARRAAPPDKAWETLADERVRPEHAEAHGQTVPDNLRFTLNSPPYDIEHEGAPAQQMARAPRDPDLSAGLRIACRCRAVTVPGIDRAVTAHPAAAAGTRVSAAVTVDHHLCVTAEFGSAEDSGARYMAAGLREAGRHLRR